MAANKEVEIIISKNRSAMCGHVVEIQTIELLAHCTSILPGNFSHLETVQTHRWTPVHP